jgi:dipeptidase D
MGVLERVVGQLETALKRQYGTWEPTLEVRVVPVESAEPGVSAEHTRQIAQLLCALPHGIQAMSGDISGLVETSVNLATVKSEQGSLKIGLSQRSSVQEEMEMLSRRIHSIGALAGVQVTDRNSYPGWKPDMHSPLLERCRSIYAQTFGVEPVVEAIHAGLECGVIGAKYDGMDMISLGPTIQGPHSPDERLHIASVGKVYRLLREILASKTG